MISVLYAPLFTAVYDESMEKVLGLMDLLADAHLITELKANSCTGKLALLRFCMAFLSDAYQLDKLNQRADLLERGCFDKDLLLDYVHRCEQAGACFNLDDGKKPFMQAGYDEALDAKAEKPVAKIIFDRPGGNNHIHLDHRLEDEHTVDTAYAFEAMLETFLFCPAGLSGPSGVNNTPPVYVLIHGSNLFETLVLNMVSCKEIGGIPYGRGEVAWRRDENIIPGTKTVEMSLLKALTWQPRRLTLCWDEDGMIRRLYLQKGLNFQGNGLWLDPHVIYRQTKDGTLASVKPELGRELWRDAGNLVRGAQGIRSTVPLENIRELVSEQSGDMDVEMVGLVTNQEAVLGRVNERFKLPAVLFEDPEKASEFKNALDICEAVYRELDKAVKWQFCHPGDKKKRSDVAQQAGEVFLHAMRTVLFVQYLQWLRENLNFRERTRRYFDAIWAVLNAQVLMGVIEQTGDDVPSIKRQNAVRGKIRKEYLSIRERSCSADE